MTNVIFNSGLIGFLIWLLLFAVSTAALAIAIRCIWVMIILSPTGQALEITPLPVMAAWYMMPARDQPREVKQKRHMLRQLLIIPLPQKLLWQGIQAIFQRKQLEP